ncbi:hypothetical protein ACO34A_08750 [Rhizobium sp. ACO-34A]|nr:hypothetical protein ACO34A_08750 [Rhizobium sp. ACO-34A]
MVNHFPEQNPPSEALGSSHNDVAKGSAAVATATDKGGFQMGRGILLWLLGVPIPLIILIMLFWR